MTSNDISNFLTSMSEAKRAFDAEPGYQSRIHELEQRILVQGQTIAHREQRIHELKQADETLIQKLRSVEAERDDAGFRALEEADKVQGLLGLVHGIVRDALQVISVVEGKESIVVNKVDHDEDQNELNSLRERLEDRDDRIQQLKSDLALAGEQLVHPFPTEGATGQGTDTVSSVVETKSSIVLEPWAAEMLEFDRRMAEGQREADPTTATSLEAVSHTDTVNTSNTVSGLTTKIDRGQSEKSPTGEQLVGSQSGQSEGPFAPTETTLSATATSIGAEPTTAVASNASGPDTWRGSGNTEWSFPSSEGLFEPQAEDGPKPAPERNRDESTRFTGRKYFDVTYFVPLYEWMNKGGAREDYYWRPAEANAPLPEPSRASHSSN